MQIKSIVIQRPHARSALRLALPAHLAKQRCHVVDCEIGNRLLVVVQRTAKPTIGIQWVTRAVAWRGGRTACGQNEIRGNQMNENHHQCNRCRHQERKLTTEAPARPDLGV